MNTGDIDCIVSEMKSSSAEMRATTEGMRAVCRTLGETALTVAKKQ